MIRVNVFNVVWSLAWAVVAYLWFGWWGVLIAAASSTRLNVCDHPYRGDDR